MRVLVASDKFKDALTAATACDTIAAALRETYPEWQVECAPLTDGGEGFVEVLTTTANGSFSSHEVTGPRGACVQARTGWMEFAQMPPAVRSLIGLRVEPSSGRLAIVEMAAASGLALLGAEERDPWKTTTAGTGQLLRYAAEAGAAHVLIGVGGSATNDLGLGALAALGVSACGTDGQPLNAWPTPELWPELAAFSGKPVPLPPIAIACDVRNPLWGPEGCSAVFGPQKGLRNDEITRMEQAMRRTAALLCAYFNQPLALADEPGAGAAGGIAWGLRVAYGARLVPGAELVSACLQLEEKLQRADWVLTGEGRFDATSLGGKGPGALAMRAAALGKRVDVFAGAIEPGLALPPRVTAHAITPPGLPLAEAFRRAPEFLRASVRALTI